MQRHLLAFYKVAKYRDNAPFKVFRTGKIPLNLNLRSSEIQVPVILPSSCKPLYV